MVIAGTPASAASMCAGTPRVRIGLLGMYASANLGDTAVQHAVMQALHARRSDLQFVGLCPNPEDAARTFGMPAFPSSGLGGLCVPQDDGSAALSVRGAIDLKALPKPLRLALSIPRIERQMRELDMLLVSGSGQISDYWGGAWAQPFRLLAWCAAAHRQRKPAATFGIGLDALSTRLGGFFCVRALRLATLRVLRDAGSATALRGMGLTADTTVCPDAAFHLRPVETGERGPRPYVVISPIARQAWPGAEDAAYDNYLGALAATADALQRDGIEVRFVVSQVRMDPPVIGRVRERMCGDAGATQWREVRTFDDYLREVGGAQLVIASRLHAVILALVAGVPVVGIAEARKVAQQMHDIGLADYMLDLRSVRVGDVLSRVERALRERAQLGAYITATTAQFRSQLDLQFDRLAEIIPR